MKMNAKFVSMAFLAAVTAVSFTSCEEESTKVDDQQQVDPDGDNDDDQDDDKALEGELKSGTALVGTITKNVTLVEGGEYTLDGGVHVAEGATITIEPGVKIVAQDGGLTPDYMLIEKGSKIMANGTVAKPIVMTATFEESGAWGGLHICGDAPVNSSLSGKKSEIGDSEFGGTNAADNSGELSYIRLEYTGQRLDSEHESNGVSFYGVGNGTQVSYLHAYRGDDDGFEFFGGTVDIKNMIATSCKDDSFDWTGGWAGRGQFLVAYQESVNDAGLPCDRMMEGDNNKSIPNDAPASSPRFANVTLVSYNNTDNNTAVLFRRGTQINLYNAIIAGDKTYSLAFDNDETVENLYSGVSNIKGVSVANDGIKYSSAVTKDENKVYAAKFAEGTDNAVEAVELTDNFVGTVASTVKSTELNKAGEDFFVEATYKGAVEAGNNWTKALVK